MPGRGMMRGGFGHAARYGRSVAGPQGWWDWPGSVGIGEAFHDLFHILRPVARDDHDVVAVCDDDEAGDSDHRQPLAGIDAQIIALGIEREDLADDDVAGGVLFAQCVTRRPAPEDRKSVVEGKSVA